MMFVLIWMLLLDAATGADQPAPNLCTRSSISANLSKTNIMAQAGDCVVLPCSVKEADNVQNIVWYKCDPPDEQIFPSNNKSTDQSDFNGRVSLKPDRGKSDCSIIIQNLSMSDSGLYQARVKDEKDSCRVEANVNLTVVNQKPTVMVPPLTGGQQTTLTCTAPGFCSESKPEITWMWRGAGEQDSQIKGNKTDFISNHTATEGYKSTLTFRVSAEHHNSNITCKISFNGETTNETKTLEVTHVKIGGNAAVKEGDALNLTCTAVGFNATSIKWTKSGSDKSLNEANGNKTQTNIGVVYLIISNVTANDSGLYTCTATNQNSTLTAQVEISVKLSPKILSDSSCRDESEVLTCVCVSEGFPSPSIEWPVLKGHTSYSVMTNVSTSRVNSTLTVSMKGWSTTIVECVSRNDAGRATHNITIKSHKSQGDDQGILGKLWKIVKELKFHFPLLIGIGIGIILATTIACLAIKCRRSRDKRSLNQFEDLEMVSTQAARKVEVVYDGIQDQEAAEGSAGQSAPDGGVEPKETEYSDIDFSAIKHRNPTEAQETTETEYAEIKKEELEERQQDREEGEILEANDEEVKLIKENGNPKESPLAEVAVGDDVPLYSDVKDVVNET